jgi:hypothetical protein
MPAPKIDFDIFKNIDGFFSTQDAKYIEYQNSQVENDRLEKMHDNMKIIINENGHLFLINRLNNKVYFFFKEDDTKKYKVFKFVITEIIVEGVDSSLNRIIFWSTDNFIVFDITPLLIQSSDESLLQKYSRNT